MIIPGNNDAERLAWLGQHRLWPVADLLHERGYIASHLATLANQLAEPQKKAMRKQLDEDRRVVSALTEAGIPVLVLKGCLLGQTVYPEPASRYRTDLDLLIDPSRIAAVETFLGQLGYRRPWEVQSPTPMRQVLWERRCSEQPFVIDLHWDLRNHPALQRCFEFEELLEKSQCLPALGAGARGMGHAHAMLNASMHYFNDYADARPCQWLLDQDLLWRAMPAQERERCRGYACQRGLAGLLAESLMRSRELFQTPVSDEEIESLKSAGQSQWRTGLIKASDTRWQAYWFALRSEPGTRRKLNRIRMGLFPPPSYIRRHYPEGSRFGLVGLYLRRILQRR